MYTKEQEVTACPENLYSESERLYTRTKEVNRRLRLISNRLSFNPEKSAEELSEVKSNDLETPIRGSHHELNTIDAALLVIERILGLDGVIPGPDGAILKGR